MASFDGLELSGSARDSVLERIKQQLGDWGVKMPAVEPLPLHFGLGRFDEIGETEFWVANESEHGYCGKFLFVFDGQTCPYHEHRAKHETFFIVKGSVLMKTPDGERILAGGDTFVVPTGTGHSFTGIGPALVLEVSMPSTRGDNFFADHGIGEDGVM